MILAGHETTAVTLFWSLVLLCGAPDEQQRVAEEACGVEITPDNAMDVMPRLVRTRAVISEALRLYPPAFALAREAIGPDRAGAIDIPRGTVLLIAPWVLHRHRRLWRDPDAFDPSRFLPDAPPPAALRLSAVRRRPARLRRRAVRARRGDAGAGDADPRISRWRWTIRTPVLPVAIVTTQPDHPPSFRLRAR